MTEPLFACPHCRHQAHQIFATPRLTFADDGNLETYWIDDRGARFRPSGDAIAPVDGVFESERSLMWDSYVEQAQWQLAMCAACKRISFYREGELVYPRLSASGVEEPHPDMPEAAAALYVEASAVLPSSRRAAAALARASLEALLKAVDETPDVRRDLNTRIGEIHDRINSGLWKVLTALRVVGNDALHGHDGALIAVYMDEGDAQVADAFFVAINQLVDELITRPRNAENLYALIAQGQRESAERAARAVKPKV